MEPPCGRGNSSGHFEVEQERGSAAEASRSAGRDQGGVADDQAGADALREDDPTPAKPPDRHGHVEVGDAFPAWYVVFRGALETVTYLVGALGWLMLIALSKESGPGPLAVFVRTTEGVMWDQLIAIPFVLGALTFYYLLYQSRLLPRWLSIWGLVGAVLYIAAPLANIFGLSFGFLMAPLGAQETVMAVWLIAGGFDPVPVASG